MAQNTPTRWERVRKILDAAAGGSTSDYGGVGRPWRLPLATLQDGGGLRRTHGRARGVGRVHRREGCGCGCATTAERPEGAEPGARFPAYPGRGAASGLVRGLRGQPPYDGSVFPRLPWGGAAVAGRRRPFISDWIDDGLPGGRPRAVPAARP